MGFYLPFHLSHRPTQALFLEQSWLCLVVPPSLGLQEVCFLQGEGQLSHSGRDTPIPVDPSRSNPEGLKDHSCFKIEIKMGFYFLSAL